MKMRRTKDLLFRVLAAFLCFLLAFGVFAGCAPVDVPGAPDDDAGEQTPSDPERPEDPDELPGPYPDALYLSGMQNFSKVGMSAEYLGTVERSVPSPTDGGLASYPVYGKDFAADDALKQAVLDENKSLIASSATYDSMDAAGALYLNGVATGEKLYRHTASLNMYGGDVNDGEPALIKRISLVPRKSGNHITGLYAPAGEVVKFEMSEEDFAATGGLKVTIGQTLANGDLNNIWMARTFDRMPLIANQMTLSAPVGYAGYALGGPIYISPVNAGVPFTVTISGAVAYSHFILGYTTQEEFERNRESSAPYFDLEVWDDAVRHSGPKAYAQKFGYDQLTEAAILWDKIALVSNQVPAGSGGEQGIIFLYDPFIAAGSMVAFVGRHTVNCPPKCLTAALDARSAQDNASDDFWGCIHEFNHHFQRFGFQPGDEVTNNAVSLVEYSLFTRISARRSREGGSYATGWNRYLDPAWALRQTLANTGAPALDSYADLLHAFGQEAFIRATQAGGGSGGTDVWYGAVSDATGYDMTYFFEDVLHTSVTESVRSQYASRSLPVFVPAALPYQTGRSYVRDGKLCYSRTAEPYAIAEGEPFTIDVANDLVLPEGFTYSVKNVTQPAFGTLEGENGVYRYTPSPDSPLSGTIYLTLAIERTDGAFEVDDVTFAIEFRQAVDGQMLERTVYTYSADAMYATPQAAYENGYAGYISAVEQDNTNRVQNGNAEIWEPQPTSNAAIEVRGKFYAEESGTYRVALRGRRLAALYLSRDGETYFRAATVENATGTPDFDLSDPAHYTDIALVQGEQVYFKAVLLVTAANSFIGVGLGKSDGGTVAPLNAYRASYVYEPFASSYFYTRDYRYDYTRALSGRQTALSARYSPWDESYAIENLFDDDAENFIHTDRTDVTADAPFELVADSGETLRANTFTIVGEPTRRYLPAAFALYGGTDLEDMALLATQEDAVYQGADVVVAFPEREVRYYRLYVTDTTATQAQHRYLAFRSCAFSYSVMGGSWTSPDDTMFEYRGNWTLTQALSTFGHGYVGENALVTFTFEGTRFAILKTGDAEVLVDGVLCDPADASEGAWLSPVLAAGEHTVTVRSRGRSTIDSFVLWRSQRSKDRINDLSPNG